MSSASDLSNPCGTASASGREAAPARGQFHIFVRDNLGLSPRTQDMALTKFTLQGRPSP